jgi:2-amino-4-hydroxy-6-hydroxymethyldihydropteridine diphosphokinase
MDTGSLAIVGLGSNLGDRGAILDQALDALQAEPHVHLHTISAYYESPPIGGPEGQGAYLNAAALLEPSIDPLSLLELLHRIEARFGRERNERWGPRTLDIDLLLYGEEVRRTPQIILPHPRLAFRRFALAPAVEVAPWSIDPLTGLTINELLAGLDRRPSLVAVAAVDPSDALAVETAARVHRALVDRLGGVAIRQSDLADSAAPATAVPAHPRDRRFAEIQAIARRMDAAEWVKKPGAAPDAWLVADFSLDRELQRASAMERKEPAPDEAAWKHVWNLFTYERAAEAAVARALAPTFVALLGDRAAATAVRDGRFPRPVLVPGSDDPDAIVAEIVTTCGATRS